jgi:hypothetical protein
MERKTNKDAQPILWKKIGGGSFHATIGGKTVIIKPGQQFSAKPHEIPEAFKDTVVPVNPMGKAVTITVEEAKVEEAKKAEEAKGEYNLRHRGGGWWDVVDENGKAQNEAALQKADAEELLNSLT